jgi:sigma-B regulation protein RsbQ
MQLVLALAVPWVVNLLLALSLQGATVEGIPLHSSATGKGPRTLIFVHGWTCDDRTWELQVPDLSRTSRVITLDLPGHGQSGSPKDGQLSMTLFARAIEAVREEYRAEHVVLVGHSMGTMAILQYARMYPQHVAALVLVDGSVSMPADAPRERMLAAARQYGESLTTREAMVQKSSFTPNTPDAVRTRVLSMTAAVPPATPLAAMEAFVDPANWKEDVFPQPALAVFSDLAAAEPDLKPAYLKTRFPLVDYHHLSGTGHFVMLERPAEFNALLNAFVEKLKL